MIASLPVNVDRKLVEAVVGAYAQMSVPSCVVDRVIEAYVALCNEWACNPKLGHVEDAAFIRDNAIAPLLNLRDELRKRETAQYG